MSRAAPDQIAKETTTEYRAFWATLPQRWKDADPLDFKCSASNANMYCGRGYVTTKGFPDYQKSFIGSPDHYFLRMYVAWKIVREECRAAAFADDPRYAAFAGMLTDEGHLIMIVSPKLLDDAEAVRDFSAWLYREDLQELRSVL